MLFGWSDASPISWALVTQVSPSVQVRFAGDTADITIVKKASGVSLTTNDVVKLSRVGTQWVIDYVIGDA